MDNNENKTNEEPKKEYAFGDLVYAICTDTLLSILNQLKPLDKPEKDLTQDEVTNRGKYCIGILLGIFATGVVYGETKKLPAGVEEKFAARAKELAKNRIKDGEEPLTEKDISNMDLTE